MQKLGLEEIGLKAMPALIAAFKDTDAALFGGQWSSADLRYQAESFNFTR